MKYLGVLLVGLMMFTLGCKTEEVEPVSEAEQLAIDIELIDNWLADNGITDTLHHSSKIRYTINKKGIGEEIPRLSDVVKVAYEGRFLDIGDVFDSSTGLELILSQTIWGWQIMVQEMKEGDELTIYLPSLYAYGTRGSGSIPPNTVIVFDIELISIRN